MSELASAGRRGPWRRLFAWGMARYGPDHDERLRPYKQRLLGPLTGTVLDLGAGAGVNLQYLQADVRYIAVEPNLHMHPYLEREAARTGRRIDLRTAVGERLPVDDGSIDAVICTLVLCSVSDVGAVLGEVRRVLRPAGRLIFIEHVAAPAGSWRRRIQALIRPIWRIAGDGCEPDRDLEAAVRAAGLGDLEVERFDTGLPIVAPHVAGVVQT